MIAGLRPISITPLKRCATCGPQGITAGIRSPSNKVAAVGTEEPDNRETTPSPRCPALPKDRPMTKRRWPCLPVIFRASAGWANDKLVHSKGSSLVAPRSAQSWRIAAMRVIVALIARLAVQRSGKIVDVYLNGAQTVNTLNESKVFCCGRHSGLVGPLEGA